MGGNGGGHAFDGRQPFGFQHGLPALTDALQHSLTLLGAPVEVGRQDGVGRLKGIGQQDVVVKGRTENALRSCPILSGVIASFLLFPV